jgi:hypothetical protein
MDVKLLVNSEVFYPRLWKNKMIYSSEAEFKIVAYNEDIKIIENEYFSDPLFVFLDE